ncbi:hypothetical protein ACWELJ_32090 [Nocardia sp. NPDC004582]
MTGGGSLALYLADHSAVSRIQTCPTVRVGESSPPIPLHRRSFAMTATAQQRADGNKDIVNLVSGGQRPTAA